MRYIGDVHGKMPQYLDIIKDCPESIQVGDFGYGFVPIPNLPMTHRQIRGNHDNPAIAKVSPTWIPDMHFDGTTFFLGGAHSIDKEQRIIGRDWWADEELSYLEFVKAQEIYADAKPEIVVTHDAPERVILVLFNSWYIKSRTGSALQSLLEIHKPKLWIFGHWHMSRNHVVDRTRFICLNELEYIDI